MQIKHYDTLKELFVVDSVTGKHATTTKERMKQWEKENIDRNNSFEDAEMYEPDVSVFGEHQYSPPQL